MLYSSNILNYSCFLCFLVQKNVDGLEQYKCNTFLYFGFYPYLRSIIFNHLARMEYNFDQIIDRRGTDSVKWDGMRCHWMREDLLPMWVADMDFATPPFIMEALKKRLEHEVLGYTFACDAWADSIARWLTARHQWNIVKERLIFSPGIVRGLAYVLHCFTQVGDKVMVMPPVYHPFFLVSQRNGRKVVYVPLRLEKGQYQIDFAEMESNIKGCRLLILSNPHNPGGRVWSPEELRQIAEICHASGTLVVSDEIHADLTLPSYKHTVFATVSEEARMNSIVFMSPSKAFNMPGLTTSYVIVENEELYGRFRTFMEASEFNEGHMFAYLSVAAAYMHGKAWLNQMLHYIEENIDFTENYLNEHIPGIRMIRPQASYLIFLDCRGLQLSTEALSNLFVNKARLALNEGTTFGKEGAGFMRMNVGCPRSVLKEALDRLRVAVAAL